MDLSSRIAVFTGTFDPITLGHLDVISRGRLLFERLVVAIGINPNKQVLFPIEERVDLAEAVVGQFPNVEVLAFEGLTVHFVRRIGAGVILRGLRTLSDMEYEFSMTLTNHRLDPGDRDRLPDGRRRICPRLQFADQAGRPLRRPRGTGALRALEPRRRRSWPRSEPSPTDRQSPGGLRCVRTTRSPSAASPATSSAA